MTAIAVPLRRTVTESVAIARRNLSHVRQVPESLIDVTIQPFMFVLLFAFVFGGSIAVTGGDYRAFVVAGVFVQTLTFNAGGTANSIATDMTNGVIDRFRVLPISRSAVIAGRVVTDLATSVIAIIVLSGAGLLVGWGINDGVANAVAGYALLLLWAFAMSWVGTYLGLLVRSPDAVMGIFFITMLPLTFVANTYAPTDGMPAAIRTFAEWNPISAVTTAVRELFGNPGTAEATAWPLQHAVPVAFGWCAVLVIVFAPLAVRRYRTMSR
jgi:ABC-2 type transport system permease protein